MSGRWRSAAGTLQTPPRQALATVGFPASPTPEANLMRRRLLTLSMFTAAFAVAAQPAFAVLNMAP